MSSDFLNPDRQIQKHGDRLPHWQQGEAMQFVTFRLGDALPLSKVRHWKEQRRLWLATYPKPWDPETEREYHRRFTWKIESWLDQGAGSCLLKDPEARNILSDALMRFQGERVHHQAWVIMPNHVHLLFKPVVPINKLIQAWKYVSATAIGKGPIWQRNYRDTLIRDGDHFTNAVRYIRKNPVKAKLPEDSFTLWQSERAARIS
jgi:REP element-mobilizing transposase RayT